MTAATPIRWEYKVWNESVGARVSDKRLEDELNALGAEGWELCAFSSDARVFKRPVS